MTPAIENDKSLKHLQRALQGAAEFVSQHLTKSVANLMLLFARSFQRIKLRLQLADPASQVFKLRTDVLYRDCLRMVHAGGVAMLACGLQLSLKLFDLFFQSLEFFLHFNLPRLPRQNRTAVGIIAA